MEIQDDGNITRYEDRHINVIATHMYLGTLFYVVRDMARSGCVCTIGTPIHVYI